MMDDLKPGELTDVQKADVLEKLIPEIEGGLNIHFYELAALHRAVDVLRRPAPENKPLTLDQLRQMDDEPVWVCGIPGHEIKWTPGWRIIDGNRVALRQWNDAVMYLYFADYGRTWLAYARKPEGSAE